MSDVVRLAAAVFFESTRCVAQPEHATAQAIKVSAQRAGAIEIKRTDITAASRFEKIGYGDSSDCIGWIE
jgi:hypothetical protein